MKTVFTNDECAHVWAQQLPGQYGQGYSVQFDGPALYSWGRHYLTGFIMPDGVALLNSRRYSSSTGKHQSRAASAVSHRRTIRIDDLTAWQDYLETAARGRPDKGESAAMLKRVERAALDLSDEAGAYLLGLAGFPAARWARIRKAAETARDKAAARSSAALLKLHRATARELGDMTPKAFALRMAEARAYGNQYAPDSALRDLVDLLYSAHRYGTANGTPADKRRRAILWARLSMARAAAERAGRKSSRVAAARETARANATIRAAIDPTRQPDSLYRSSRWAALTAAIGKLLVNACTLPPATRANVNRLWTLAEVARVELVRRELEEEHAKQAAARAAWLAGESSSLPYGATDATGGALIRAVGVERDAAGEITGGTLETSQRASVPLCHALRAFRFLKLCHDTGRTWNANGRTIRVGHYRIDSVSPSGDFVAGCHRINWNEVERLALELGVFALPASEEALEPSTAAA
jgi:hypothetical protein